MEVSKKNPNAKLKNFAKPRDFKHASMHHTVDHKALSPLSLSHTHKKHLLKPRSTGANTRLRRAALRAR